MQAVARNIIRDHRQGPDGPWEYRQEFVDPVLAFFDELTLYKGEWAGQQFRLLNWQRLVIAELHGWRCKADLEERRYKKVMLLIARKQGKSHFTAGLLLYEAACGSDYGEIVCAATQRKQASVVYEMCKELCVRTSVDVTGPTSSTKEEGLKFEHTGSRIFPVSREAKTLLGADVSVACFDEASVIEDREVFEAVETGQGARKTRLSLMLTTASATQDTVFYERYSALKHSLLNGDRLKDTLPVFYAADNEDDIRNEKAWTKSMPALGEIYGPEYIREELEAARMSPASWIAKARFFFNLWLTGEDQWIERHLWQACEKERPPSDVLADAPLYVGIDWSQVADLTAVCLLYDLGAGRFWSEWKFWLPEDAYRRAKDEPERQYHMAVDSGVLHIQADRHAIYHGEIEDYLVRQNEIHSDLRMISSDPWNAQTSIEKLNDIGLPIVEVSQSIAKLNEPTKAAYRLIVEERVGHDGNAFLEWQLSNTIVYVDVNSNNKIRKDINHPERKMDGMIALVNAVAASLGDTGEFTFEVIKIDG